MQWRRFSLLPFFFILLTQPAVAAEAITERDWMMQVVEAIGGSFGLPDEPVAADYQRILEGRRQYRIEAEGHFDPDDRVSVQAFSSFGPFSGNGWLSGISAPTVAHLRFNLPLGGDFAVTVALRLPGHKIRIGEQTVESDGSDRFAPYPLGIFTLPAGAHTIEFSLPPNSAVDYVEFTAPSLPPIQPVEGWQPDMPLTLATMAETVAQLFALTPLLPSTGEPILIEAESVALLPHGAAITQASHLGVPSGGSWVRAGAIPALLRIPFSRPQGGIYALQMRGAADAPVTVTINENLAQSVSPRPYLETVPIGSFILPAGENTVDFQLPPRGGLDALQLISAAGKADLLRLTGLAGQADPPDALLVEKYLALIAALGRSR